MTAASLCLACPATPSPNDRDADQAKMGLPKPEAAATESRDAVSGEEVAVSPAPTGREAGDGPTANGDPSGTETGPSPAAVEAIEKRAEAAQERAKADIERAGNLALDLSEALKSQKLENVLALTPFDAGEFAKACKGAKLADEREVAARANHCLRSIDWGTVSDVRVTGGEASGEPSACKGYDAMQRVRLLVVSSKGNTIIELNEPFGREGQALAFSGAMVCRPQE
jgi:hypothetical protein